MNKKIAIMQPYFFPYLGYFQLIHCVDEFIFYDDVNYIKSGWINRNRIVSKATGNKPVYFGMPLQNSSSFKKIHNTFVNPGGQWREKTLKTLKNCYSRHNNFDEIYKLAESVILHDSNNLAELSALSVQNICEYLGIETEIITSSRSFNNCNLGATERIVDICKQRNANEYINAIGGKKLYEKKRFVSHDLELGFLQTKHFEYEWWNLSILHLLMILGKQKVLKMLEGYEIV